MKMRVSSRIPALLALTFAASCFACALCSSFGFYKSLDNAYLCIRSDYTQNLSAVAVASKVFCSALCAQNERCRAFTLANGLCQMFVFDACSKQVRDCNCSRKGQVFVKQQPGLEPGKLCPSGYGDDLCGVKYKLNVGTGLWSPSRQKCESESGLVIMADVTDATEMNQVDMLYGKYNIGAFWLGGLQAPGSPEPAGGWYWVACNIALNGSLWGTGEPNNNPANENVTVRWTLDTNINDCSEFSGIPQGVLCECVSPFD